MRRRPYLWIVLVGVVTAAGAGWTSVSALLAGFDPMSLAWAGGEAGRHLRPAETLPTSLHGTLNGHRTFYSADENGLWRLGLPQDPTDFGCTTTCHVGSISPADGGCMVCHGETPTGPPVDPVEDDTCLTCHNRQVAEKMFVGLGLLRDVHEDMACMDCHSKREMHGDGTEYISLLQPGAMDTRCETCHDAKKESKHNLFHSIHLNRVDCSACHVESVLGCNNCHFDKGVIFGQPQVGFKLLVEHEGKVQAGDYMTLTLSGENNDCAGAFYVIAPNHAHAITSAEELSCGDCHDNAAIRAYNDTGKIDVVTWQEGQGLVSPSGIIPVPPDWQEALQFAFACLPGDPSGSMDPANWVLREGDADVKQMLVELKLGAPLSDRQMKALSKPRGKQK